MYVRVLEPFCDGYSSQAEEGVHGFDPEREYFVHKVESYSESGNGFVVLVNDQREIWWVDNRHVRVSRETENSLPPMPAKASNGATVF